MKLANLSAAVHVAWIHLDLAAYKQYYRACKYVSEVFESAVALRSTSPSASHVLAMDMNDCI
jgi:hypothetical protein